VKNVYLSYDIVIAGISLVVSAFMLAVTVRASRKGGPKAVIYLGTAFAVILAVNLLFVLSVFKLLLPGSDFIIIFLVSDLILLGIFYLGAVRGI